MSRRICCLFLLLFFGLHSSCRKVADYPTTAMEPTIKKGETVRLDFGAYKNAKPERWDIVMFTFKNSSKLHAARIVGLPNEHILVLTNSILIDGNKIEMPKNLIGIRYQNFVTYGKDAKYRHELPHCDYQLGNGEYFILGDNTGNAADSRVYGGVDISDISARVLTD